ncbi:hypothetical protein DFH08DRAFT_739197 [Mycena albidolilacea]|uniref:BAG domain-containing protein n=1 Tax=Mycena albidolilacea TaxID=1033008 RepID=A0AAD7EW91_9AGAR|nr:hypothetical protein DFH08DRAFT_739197 [Mycena albidolilacea]
MFSFSPRSQSYYQPSPYYQPSAYYQPSPYARALAQQQQQQRARDLAVAREMERQRLARSQYFPHGYDYEPESDEEDYYLNPRQRALLEAKRHQAALEQRRQAAAHMAHENALKQQAARTAEKESTPPQSPRRSVSPLRSASPPRSVSPPVAERNSPAPKATSPVPQQSPPSPSPERLEEAATKIQTQYRIHRALRAISALASQFESLKASFVPPTTIDYQAGDGTVSSVPVPASESSSSTASAAGAKLAFTPTNVPLHTYTELLSRLLVALDAVESRGDRGVRERRRAVVRAVEAEAARVEAFWRSVWAAHHQEQEQRADEEEEEVSAMAIDEVDALPELAAPESDSDVEADLSTPPETPAPSPELVLPQESELAEDGVIVDTLTEEEKLPADDFVLV